ncbi:MAG: amidohydrolase family protein [Deltaproteobacteria bacterium]
MIDAHIHIFPRYRSVKAVRWLKRHIPSLDVQETVDESDILKKLENCGVSSFFNYVYPLSPDETEFLNGFNHELSRRVPKAVSFGSIHPENENKEEIVRTAIIDLDLIGLKFHPFVQGFSILDERMDEVYRTLEVLRRPVVFHTGFDRLYGARLAPEEMEVFLKRYPGLVVVIAHMFYPHIDRAFDLLERYENVYLDGTNVFSGYREPTNGENIFDGFLVEESGTETYRVFFNYPLKDIERHSTRLMVGSDYPVAMNSPEEIYEHVRMLPVSEETRTDISADTARSFVERFKPGFFDRACA